MRSIRSYFDVLYKKGIKYCITKAITKIEDGITFNVFHLMYDREPLEDIIVIESHNDFDCNGGAFYNYLLKRGANERYKIIWLIKNPLDRELPNNVFAYDFYSYSLQKDYFLSRAKYLLYDDFCIKKQREDQVIVYCTHGSCTFKNVRGLIDVPEEVDYILSSSKAYDPYMCDNFSIVFPNEKMLHIGYPSNDILFEVGTNEMRKISCVDYERKILWLPTFRSSVSGRRDSEIELPFGIPIINNAEQFLLLNDYLIKNNCLLVIKLHPMQDLKAIKEIPQLSNIKLVDVNQTKEKDIDVYRLMVSADALISDYSSSTFSYLLLNRPIGFALSDLEYYKPGFSVEDMDRYLPGERIISIDDLEEFVGNVVNNIDSYSTERKELMDWLYEYQDGNACKRLYDFLDL